MYALEVLKPRFWPKNYCFKLRQLAHIKILCYLQASNHLNVFYAWNISGFICLVSWCFVIKFKWLHIWCYNYKRYYLKPLMRFCCVSSLWLIFQVKNASDVESMRKITFFQMMCLTNGSFVLLILLPLVANMSGWRKKNLMLLLCAQIAYLFLVVSVFQHFLWKFLLPAILILDLADNCVAEYANVLFSKSSYESYDINHATAAIIKFIKSN